MRSTDFIFRFWLLTVSKLSFQVWKACAKIIFHIPHFTDEALKCICHGQTKYTGKICSTNNKSPWFLKGFPAETEGFEPSYRDEPINAFRVRRVTAASLRLHKTDDTIIHGIAQIVNLIFQKLYLPGNRSAMFFFLCKRARRCMAERLFFSLISKEQIHAVCQPVPQLFQNCCGVIRRLVSQLNINRRYCRIRGLRQIHCHFPTGKNLHSCAL